MENKFEFKSKNEMAMIRTAIFELDLTQKQISRKIGKPESVVSEVLRGRKKAHPTFCLIKSFLATEILNRKN
jgi:transcriptional regulator with XRE-family HTH domain